jgi:hypothetical protein
VSAGRGSAASSNSQSKPGRTSSARQSGFAPCDAAVRREQLSLHPEEDRRHRRPGQSLAGESSQYRTSRCRPMVRASSVIVHCMTHPLLLSGQPFISASASPGFFHSRFDSSSFRPPPRRPRVQSDVPETAGGTGPIHGLKQSVTVSAGKNCLYIGFHAPILRKCSSTDFGAH